jgi:rhomboid family GlyGly-CTERM serine protease
VLNESATRGAALGWRLPWATLLFAAFAIALRIHPEAADALALAPDRVRGGAWWLVLTGHFVHYNAPHAIGDIAGFLLWSSAVEMRSRTMALAGTVASALAISVVVVARCPDVAEYRGLSGIDCALFAELVAMTLMGLRGRPVALALVLACAGTLAAKTAFELVNGHALLAPDLGSGTVLLPAAHVAGAITGIAVALLFRAQRRANGVETVLVQPCISIDRQ